MDEENQPKVPGVHKAALGSTKLDPGLLKGLRQAIDLTKLIDPNILKSVAPAAKEFTFLQPEILKSIQNASIARPFLPPQWDLMIQNWMKISRDLETFQSLAKAASSFDLAPFLDVFKHPAKQGKKAQLVESTGWLPHYTTPFDLIDPERQSNETAAQALSDFYKNSWKTVEAQFIQSLSNYDIDEESKATFKEALIAHGHGLYRVASRLLFPEIERVASNEFYGGRRKVLSDDGKQLVGITSLPEIRRGAGELPAGEILAYEFGMNLFKKMEAHLYEKVGDNEIEIAKFARDPVPNRHAALHGIVSYASAQNSLNALIMTDFMFHLISCMKRYMIQEGIADQKIEESGSDR
jgi:hypothetical protein